MFQTIELTVGTPYPGYKLNLVDIFKHINNEELIVVLDVVKTSKGGFVCAILGKAVFEPLIVDNQCDEILPVKYYIVDDDNVLDTSHTIIDRNVKFNSDYIKIL